MIKNPVVIAVCGKGGVGKTCISALIVKMLSEDKDAKILAIDADPAIGLSIPLGVAVKKTVDNIRNDLIERLEKKEIPDKKELLKSLDYELFSAIEETDNLAFLAIGRPEGDGCYCQVNSLLKDIIRDLAINFDYVVIDAEAGVEQINRRVMEMVTHLILVSDASMKGRNVVKTIHAVAEKKCRFVKSGLILNRMKDKSETDQIFATTDLSLAAALIENETIRTFDRDGKNFFHLPHSESIDTFSNSLKSFLNKDVDFF